MNTSNHSRVVNAWCLYDWANSAFATTVMAALFPPFYRSLAQASGLSAATATAFWAYTVAIALLISAILAPLLGAIADHVGKRKGFLAFFAGAGILFTGLFLLIGRDTWALASLLFAAANIGFAGANVFYDSLLPSVAEGDDMDRISTRGYALGYVGGGVLLAVNALWCMKPEWFFFPSQAAAIRASFVSVAVWWLIFSLPLFRRVPEPGSPLPPLAKGGEKAPSPLSVFQGTTDFEEGWGEGEPKQEPVHPTRSGGISDAVFAGFRRLGTTFQELRRYRQLAIFLAAFWLYNDGIGSIIKLATAYGDEIGISVTDMITALIVTQFVGIPFSFWFGSLARRFGARPMISVGLVVYVFICVGAYVMQHTWQYYLLAFAVGMVQGGTQALSRSLFASMVPKHKSAEFFGFFSTSAKFAGIFGPLLFGVIAQIAGQSRLSILSLIVFFLAGLVLLWKVDVEEGKRAAAFGEPGAFFS